MLKRFILNNRQKGIEEGERLGMGVEKNKPIEAERASKIREYMDLTYRQGGGVWPPGDGCSADPVNRKRTLKVCK